MKKVFAFTDGLTRLPTHYCPGCTHGVIHRMIGEIMVELGIRERTVGIAPVGCSVLAYKYFNCDMFEASHGRAPAVATGAKRTRPDLMLFTYQGDGDLASIGMAEIIHAANRGEKFTTIFVNNAIYGMTGGQMAPTTMPRQRSTTTPAGRDPAECGFPIRMAELLTTLTTPAFIARVSSHTAAQSVRAKKVIKEAFEHQMAGTCFTFVEVLSICPTNWGLSPKESNRWLEREMMPYYPLGVFKRPQESTGGDHGKH
ncbi:MAG: thiamine pyrophosphate-dependent enzyme [Myxococcota bacterium]|jgi:2-oxoglutarate ferredoxin oxidoreductase subunit beta|nr:thiamine pyrophosphate-dependent enzyme [Myxococcota bacterium]